MARRDESQITDHRDFRAMLGSDVLACTVFLGELSFTLELPALGCVTIGRGSDADIQIVGGGVSRAHARLDLLREQAMVEDLGSRNGTFVNGERVVSPRGAGQGDEIGIGDARLVLLRRTAVPGGVLVALLQSAFVQRLRVELDAAKDQGRTWHVVAARLGKRWWEVKALGAAHLRLPAGSLAGVYSDRILTFAMPADPQGARAAEAALAQTLRASGLEVATGLASSTSVPSARDMVDAALRALLSERPVAATPLAEQQVVLDPAMIRLHEQARRIAPSAVNVLIVGETGAGKEVFARTIHEASGRTGPLVTVNAAALPEQLMESELFGHERGAFSGATQTKVGLIESADKGTLFLDEIGELPMPMQAKLLRVLEDHVVRRIGATAERKVDVRVIAATNCDLEANVAERRFRRDLLFRLNACTIVVPPLRERPAEIAQFAEEFLRRVAPEHGVPSQISPGAMAILKRHAWPGNVRELRNVIERAAALSDGVIEAEHLPDALLAPAAPTLPPTAPDVRDSLNEFERGRILDALTRTGGNQTRAAELLGLPRRTLSYKMARLGIRVP